MSVLSFLPLLSLLFLIAPSAAQNTQPGRPRWNSWWCRLTRSCGNQQQPPRNPPRCCPTGGIWSSWNSTTACSDECGGFGTKTMERYCLTASTCGPCSGPNKKTVQCGFSPCKFPRNSCANEMKATAVGNQILCSNGQPVEQENLPKASCCPPGGLMDIWSDWTDCSAGTCGSCQSSTRTRKCRTEAYGCGACSLQTQTETRPCLTAPCTFPSPSCCTGFRAMASGNQILCMQ